MVIRAAVGAELAAAHGRPGRALDVPLAELLREEAAPPPPPASLVAFAAGPRSGREVRRLACEESVYATTVRAQFLAAVTAMTVLPRRFDELDWHRVLDLIVLRSPR